MHEASGRDQATTSESGAGRGVLALVLTGALLGLVYNYIGLESRRPWGLDWIGQDPLTTLASMESVASDGETAPPASTYISDDPLAIPGTAAVAAALPQIPDVGRPVEMHLDALKQYFDADAAMIVDARESEEFLEGHIAGAVSLPYDEAVTDPVRLEQLNPDGLPIVTYCGGGSCEVSLSLAYELVYSGHHPVAVYMGGFPEWEQAGYPVERGAGGKS
jgi:rhodanese-related sulfurtransferase